MERCALKISSIETMVSFQIVLVCDGGAQSRWLSLSSCVVVADQEKSMSYSREYHQSEMVYTRLLVPTVPTQQPQTFYSTAPTPMSLVPTSYMYIVSRCTVNIKNAPVTIHVGIHQQPALSVIREGPGRL